MNTMEVLTHGHFLISRPIEALPDPLSNFKSKSIQCSWNLCQKLTHNLWKRWFSDYFTSVRRFTKWHTSSRNLKVSDLVLLKEDGMVPAKWPLGRVIVTYPGRDDVVSVVTVRTAIGTYKRPITKVAPLISHQLQLCPSLNLCYSICYTITPLMLHSLLLLTL